jgi:MOSC domain-containing protein YiiM
MIQAVPLVKSRPRTRCGLVVAVCVSGGGIPKHAVTAAQVTAAGLAGDGHAHAKHIRAQRALSLFDMEILAQLRNEGFALYPGAIGENLTVVGLHVQRLPPGTLLETGDVVLRLEEPRKPCYVLDAIDPCLKDVIVGRCGFMASVVHGGLIEPGNRIVTLPNDACLPVVP